MTTPAPAHRRLICLEEHVLDAGVARASGPAMTAAAPFMADWGSRVTDGIDIADATRPHVVSREASSRLLLDTGASRLEDMDRAGIDMQVLSVGGSPQHIPDAKEAVDLIRRANDSLAGTVRDHPDRFAAFATLPWQDPAAAAEELTRCVQQLGMVGTLLNGRPGQAFLDDPRYREVLATLAELGVPIYLHPGVPVAEVHDAYYAGFDPEVSARFGMFGWGWHHEAGIGVVRLILSGAFDRYPGLQVISGHWGEMVPFYLQRLDDSIPREASGLSRTITQTYRDQVLVTPSGMLTEPQFTFCLNVLGADRMLFSVDYPYQSLDGVRSFIEGLAVPEAEKDAIAHRNAETLLHLG